MAPFRTIATESHRTMSNPASSISGRESIGPVLGRVPSGLFIVSAADGAGRETAMLASWVQQASFDPPAVTVAVNSQRFLNEWLDRHPRLAVSILGESQRSLLKLFGKGFEPDEPAFAGVNVVRGATGLPLLADCLGSLEGHVAGRMASGDHVIYLVEITSARAGVEVAAEPAVHVRKNGLRY